MPALSDVTISQMALSHLGAQYTLTALSDPTTEARACNLWYDISRQTALSTYDWSFARVRATLAAHADPPPAGQWAFRYALPSDILKARYIENPFGMRTGFVYTGYSLEWGNVMEVIPFQVELSGSTRSLVTNIGPATPGPVNLVYTKDLTTATLFSMSFAKALSYLLAYNITMAVTRKADLAANMLAQYEYARRLASEEDANEQVADLPPEAPWIRVR